VNKIFLKGIKPGLFLLWLIVSILMASLCLKANNEEDSLIVVPDSMGRLVSVPKNPRRILPFTLAATELIRLMDGMDRIVGTTTTIKQRADLMPDIINIPDIGRGFTPNLEELVRLSPDLVITWCDYPGPELERQLEPLGIKVLRLDLMKPQYFYQETRLLAKILGPKASEKAEIFLNWYYSLDTEYQELLHKSGQGRKTFLIEQAQMGTVIGNTSGIHDTIVLAGGDNLASNIPKTYADVGTEWMIRANPQFLLKIFRNSNEPRSEIPRRMEEMQNSVLSRKGWEDMQAILNKNVYVLDADLCQGPRNIVGIYTIAHWFYPDLVSTEKATIIMSNYLEKFQNISVVP
jgi:iron complex transport system substrate-binding protein